jgi:hypothetical protein
MITMVGQTYEVAGLKLTAVGITCANMKCPHD